MFDVVEYTQWVAGRADTAPLVYGIQLLVSF